MNVIVIGDVMIDAYLWGKVDRISPEAPVPVVAINQKENRLGGAANVALNLKTLGANPIICSVIGDDERKDEFAALLENNGFSQAGIIHAKNRITTIKTRVISQGHHLLRIDEEMSSAISESYEDALIARVAQLINTEKIDVIIFEDYNKGVLTKKVIKEVIALANAAGIPTAVDPKKDNFFEYKNVSLFKPNLKELREGLKLDFDKKNKSELITAVTQLESHLNNKISLVTLSELGVLVKESEKITLIPAHLREILDVSGAGDTVISVAALCLAANIETENLAALSNLAGGLVCEKVGVVPINKEQLLKEAMRLL
jgi:rfaE bifunctional protein kinase chain/domain